MTTARFDFLACKGRKVILDGEECIPMVVRSSTGVRRMLLFPDGRKTEVIPDDQMRAN